MTLSPQQGLSANVQRMRHDMDYKPVLSIINGLIPQHIMTELATSLQEVYRINLIGGQGSRRQVSEILIKLGIQPN